MSLAKTTLLSALSAAAWNTLLLMLGEIFASNWQKVASYLQLYSVVVTGLVVVIALILVWQYWRRR